MGWDGKQGSAGVLLFCVCFAVWWAFPRLAGAEPPGWFAALMTRCRGAAADRPTMAEIHDEIAGNPTRRPYLPEDAAPNPFPLSAVRCPRCRRRPDHEYQRQCAACSTELVAVFLQLLDSEDAPALVRLDIEGPAREAASKALRTDDPVLSLQAGTRVRLPTGLAIGFLHPCFSEWRAPVVGSTR